MNLHTKIPQNLFVLFVCEIIMSTTKVQPTIGLREKFNPIEITSGVQSKREAKYITDKKEKIKIVFRDKSKYVRSNGIKNNVDIEMMEAKEYNDGEINILTANKILENNGVAER